MAPKKQQVTFLDVVKACDDFPYDSKAGDYYQLCLPSPNGSSDSQAYGYMLPDIVWKMPWTAAFQVSHDHPRHVMVLDTSNGSNTATAVNKAFQDVIDACIDQDLFHVLCKRHSEPFSVVGAKYGSESVHVERFATTLFGLTTRGAHMVAYAMKDDQMMIWIPRRSAHLYTYPGMLDTTVAGGVKAGASPFQTIVEEADEEASLPENYVRHYAKSRGVLSHMAVTGKGFSGEQGLLNPDYIYVYDIELEAGIVPTPHDEEVNEFYCMSIEALMTALLNEEFKPDSGAVLVDFLIRHGIITPENEPDFVEISMRLHRWLPFPTG